MQYLVQLQTIEQLTELANIEGVSVQNCNDRLQAAVETTAAAAEIVTKKYAVTALQQA